MSSPQASIKKQDKLAKEVGGDDVEADYYRHVRDGGYTPSEIKPNDVSDGEEDEEDFEDDEDLEEDEELEDNEDVEDDEGIEEEESEEEEEDDEEDTLISEVFRVRVLSDFAGEMKEDLSIETGDVLTIKEAREDGWWLAEDSQGNVGVVPKTLVERISDSPVDQHPQERKPAKAGNESSTPAEPVKLARSGTELWGKVLGDVRDKKTSVTDVLKAMGAMPSGFRSPTLAAVMSQGKYRIGAWLYPKLTSSNLAYRDLHWDPMDNKLRQHHVRITRHCSILSARMVPAVGTGVNVLTRQIHIALWDGKNVLSNIHVVRMVPGEKNVMLWNIDKNPQMSVFDADFLVRSDTQLANVGLLFELSVSYERTKTGEKSEVSCGWCVLKLFQDSGAPSENRNWELALNGGTPFESNVALDPSSGARVTGGLMQSLMKVNRQPRLIVKLAPVTKIAKELYDLLPETLVTAVQYTPFVARYRELMAEHLVQDPDTIMTTDLISDPILSTFPNVLSQPDIMDALKTIWEERSKKSLRRSIRQRERQEKQTLFRNVYMDTVFPLVKLVSLPPMTVANAEPERSRVILDFLARKDTVNTLLSDEFIYKPFNVNRMCFDVMSTQYGQR